MILGTEETLAKLLRESPTILARFEAPPGATNGAITEMTPPYPLRLPGKFIISKASMCRQKLGVEVLDYALY